MFYEKRFTITVSENISTNSMKYSVLVWLTECFKKIWYSCVI